MNNKKRSYFLHTNLRMILILYIKIGLVKFWQVNIPCRGWGNNNVTRSLNNFRKVLCHCKIPIPNNRKVVIPKKRKMLCRWILIIESHLLKKKKVDRQGNTKAVLLLNITHFPIVDLKLGSSDHFGRRQSVFFSSLFSDRLYLLTTRFVKPKIWYVNLILG